MRRMLALTLLLAACGGAQKPLVCPSALPGASGFEQRKTYDVYPVEGATPDEFAENARRAAPFARHAGNTAAGNTESKLCWMVAFAEDTAGCHIAALRVTHLVRITLPRWTLPKDAPPKFVAWYDGAAAQLATHEEGHFAIADAAARAFYARATALGAAPSCEALSSEVQSLAEAVNADVKRKNAQYDAATQHGTVGP